MDKPTDFSGIQHNHLSMTTASLLMHEYTGIDKVTLFFKSEIIQMLKNRITELEEIEKQNNKNNIIGINLANDKKAYIYNEKFDLTKILERKGEINCLNRLLESINK